MPLRIGNAFLSSSQCVSHTYTPPILGYLTSEDRQHAREWECVVEWCLSTHVEMCARASESNTAGKKRKALCRQVRWSCCMWFCAQTFSYKRERKFFWEHFTLYTNRNRQIYSMCVYRRDFQWWPRQVLSLCVCSQLLTQHFNKSRLSHAWIFSTLKRTHTCLHTGQTEQQNPTCNKLKHDSCPEQSPKQQLHFSVLPTV